MDKETFVKLAKGFMKQEIYEEEYYDAIKSVATKHGQTIDFLGSSVCTGLIMNPVLDVLGDDFSYFNYDCKANFDKFNEGVTLADGSHPDVHSLEDLYDFAKNEGSI